MFTDPLMNDEGFFKRTICPDFDPRQIQIEFFWPLTEQIPLDLNYEKCDTRESKGLTVTGGTGYLLTVASDGPTWTTSIAPTLSVSATNAVGTLSIGGVNVGLESEPKWYQRLLYKALGFKWKDK